MTGTLPVAERIPQGVPIQPEIIEPSIIDEGAASSDGAIVGNGGVNQEPEQVFSRAHNNGQEFSGTVEQARKVCPALGRMSVENARATLQEEDLAARVMRRGREKREAEASKPNESKADSDKPVDAEKGSKQLEANQSAVSSESVILKQSKDMPIQLPTPEWHDLFVSQAEAVMPPQVTRDIRDETVKILANEGKNPAGLTVEVEPSHLDTLANVRLGMAKKSGEKIRYTIEPDKEAMVSHATVEEEARPVFYETAEIQAIVEPAHLTVHKETEIIEQQEILADYALLGEDDAILLMADFKQSKAEVHEVENVPLGEIIVASPADIEVFGLAPVESLTVLSASELPATVKEIEAAILQLVEALGLTEADETQNVDQILEEIIALPDAIEANTDDAVMTVEQNLEGLFARLFEESGVESTPELIKSFVELTKAHYLKESLPINIETEDEIQTLPDEIGTREFLQKLRHGLSSMKQAVAHFYEIGRSIMRLYTMGGNVAQSVTT